jgi:hypothetical protein
MQNVFDRIQEEDDSPGLVCSSCKAPLYPTYWIGAFIVRAWQLHSRDCPGCQADKMIRDELDPYFKKIAYIYQIKN